jgi:hypothetical protein
MPVLADVRVIPEHLVESRRRLAEAWPTGAPEPASDPEEQLAPESEPEPVARNGDETGELGSGEMLERRTGTDRRAGVDRRQLAGGSAAARVFAFVSDDRRGGIERRSGLDRRAAQPEPEHVRRR